MNCLIHKNKKGTRFLGALSAYTKKRCRCNNCRTARQEYLREHRKNNRETYLENQKKHNKAYFSSVKGKEAMYRGVAKRQDRYGSWIEHWTEENHAAWRKLIVERDRLVEETGVAHDIDHIIPLAAGGPHHPANCRVITASENRSRPIDGSDL